MPHRSAIRGAFLRRGTVVLGALIASVLLVGLLGPGGVRAASPEPSNDLGGDTRSPGAGPGLVGAPGLAIGGVILLGLVAAGLTTAYIRFTGGARAPVAPVAPVTPVPPVAPVAPVSSAPVGAASAEPTAGRAGEGTETG
ncbi:MAG TPA: hypothetical protein VEG29_01725 [Candidatus Binatia bacterium]|nr:hypothetical protein [Candidatus Binatia bacterium]